MTGLAAGGGRPTSVTTVDCSSAWAWHAAGTYRITDGPRRRRRRTAALRASEFLAGYNANLDKARAGCCGRSSRSTAAKSRGPNLMVLVGQRRPRIDGLQDVRFRRWAAPMSGSLKSFNWGPEGNVARRRTLQRRTPARRAASAAVQMGPDLRQSGRDQTAIRDPGRSSEGHPRNVSSAMAMKRRKRPSR